MDRSAYSYLLGLYLGDGYILQMKPGVYRFNLYMSRRYPTIVKEATAAIASVRGGRCRPAHRVRTGDVEIYAYWKHWPCVFPQHGPGRKHHRRIRLASWQRAIVTADTESFVRGLIHSDGSRVINRVKGYEYPRYHFSNRSSDIRELFSSACARLGVEARRTSRFDVAVSRREHVARLEAFIGPKS